MRKNNTLSYLRPDGKSQVSIRYEDDKPVAVETVVIAAQHAAEVDLETIQKDVKENVIDQIIRPP